MIYYLKSLTTQPLFPDWQFDDPTEGISEQGLVTNKSPSGPDIRDTQAVGFSENVGHFHKIMITQ
jgi:hypothetical protein